MVFIAFVLFQKLRFEPNLPGRPPMRGLRFLRVRLDGRPVSTEDLERPGVG